MLATVTIQNVITMPVNPTVALSYTVCCLCHSTLETSDIVAVIERKEVPEDDTYLVSKRVGQVLVDFNSSHELLKCFAYMSAL